MRIMHVLAGAWPGSGLAEAVAGLACELKALGHDVTVASIDSPLASSMVQAQASGVRIVMFRPSHPHCVSYSSEMHARLGATVMAADIVHVHGCWTYPVWWACHLALKHRKPLIVSPHGCLYPIRLRHSAWKKRLAGLFDRHYLSRAAVLHGTCQNEIEAIAAYVGLQGQHQTVIIPNGVATQAFEGEVDRDYWCKRFPVLRDKKIVLYLGRLHSLKGLDLLIRAWGAIDHDSPFALVIAGPDEQGTLRVLQEQARQLGVERCVLFCGLLQGDERKQAMRNADLFVLPTRNENFGIVVAEALACGVPVITTKGAPWAELQGSPASSIGRNSTGRCGWWVDIGAEPLATALREALGLTDEERQAMGENGRRLVEAKYQWLGIAREFEQVYEALIKQRGRASECVWC